MEILEEHPDLDVVIRSTDLSVPENVYLLYEGLKDYGIETWVNNAGFGNYGSVAATMPNSVLVAAGASTFAFIFAPASFSSHASPSVNVLT